MTESYILLPKGGYCYGVEAGHASGEITELHGGFKTRDQALSAAKQLLLKYSDYAYAKVVKIETPQA